MIPVIRRALAKRKLFGIVPGQRLYLVNEKTTIH
jgi:hypothetical protein